MMLEHIFPERFDPFRSISPRRQKAIAFGLLAATAGVAAYEWQEVRDVTARLCGTQEPAASACHAEAMKTFKEILLGGDPYRRAMDEAKANAEAFDKRQADMGKAIADFQSRTRLAEGSWGRPGTAMAEFADHSLIRLPACDSGERPGFGFGPGGNTPANLKIHYEQRGSFLLLDLYTDVPGGRLAADPSFNANVAVFCAPPPPLQAMLPLGIQEVKP